ncbi:hypothetical protein QBC40DRAFT_349877 [Triangularia verruculosa]|uniref:Uncharacterized protein n=1 Tax=Triangularia verruculosa TaxID=2587418 RepID=A0AAN6XE02_9PEZI|nr:hypothetical protein QBC40DRAFT_349877 [Triangularia verruculosa]
MFTTTMTVTAVVTTTHFTTSFAPTTIKAKSTIASGTTVTRNSTIEKPQTITTTKEGKTVTSYNTITSTVDKLKTITTSMEAKTVSVNVTVTQTVSSKDYYTSIAPAGQRRMERTEKSGIHFQWAGRKYIQLNEPLEDLDLMLWQITAPLPTALGSEFLTNLNKYPSVYDDSERSADSSSAADDLVCKDKTQTKPINAEVLEEYLRILGKFNGKWTIDPNQCHRLGCRQNTALWWCNSNPDEAHHGVAATTTTLDLLKKASSLLDHCVRNGGHSGWIWWPKGDTHAYNTRIVMSYANCDDSPFKSPFDYEDQQESGWGHD